MDLSEIPFDVPVILQSVHFEKNLHNPLGSKEARCLTDNGDIYETLILRHVRDDKVAIESARNGRYLQVRASGKCVFDPKQAGEWELFTMETDASCALYFVSCHTGNVLQCDDNDVVKCPSQRCQRCEAWRIMEPSTITTDDQEQSDSDPRYVLSGKDRQNLVIELARCGKTPKEIEEIVIKIFDAPDASSAIAVPVAKE